MYLLGYQAAARATSSIYGEVGRAVPHRGRQRAAAERDRRLRRPAERQARLGDAVDHGERGRHRVDDVLDARPDADRDGRSRDPDAPVRGAAHARLLGRELRSAEEDGDHAARRRQERQAPAAVQDALVEHARVERQPLQRPRAPERLGRDARRRAAPPGILVDYSGGNVSAALKPSTPYSNIGSNPQVATYANATLGRLETLFPGISKQWNGKATLSTPFLDPNLNLAYSYWKPGQYVGVLRLRGRGAGQHPLRRRALLAGLPGLHGRRRQRRVPARRARCSPRTSRASRGRRGDVLRRDPDLQARSSGLRHGILVLAEVLLRELVDLRVGAVGRELGAAVDRDPLVGRRSGRRRSAPRAGRARGASASRGRSRC